MYHVTCVMHNTRTSKRMIDYKVKAGRPEYLEPAEENKLIEILVNIIRESHLKILALNICADHLHFVLVCSPPAIDGYCRENEICISKRIQYLARNYSAFDTGGDTGDNGACPIVKRAATRKYSKLSLGTEVQQERN